MRRPHWCRCCGMAATSAYCERCGEHVVRHARTVRNAILAAFGAEGLSRYENTLRAQRLEGHHATNRRSA